MPERWVVQYSQTVGVTEDQHITPIDDVIPHDLMRTCWCQPVVRETACGCHAEVIHRSADGRELTEEPKPTVPPASRH